VRKPGWKSAPGVHVTCVSRLLCKRPAAAAAAAATAIIRVQYSHQRSIIDSVTVPAPDIPSPKHSPTPYAISPLSAEFHRPSFSEERNTGVENTAVLERDIATGMNYRAAITN